MATIQWITNSGTSDWSVSSNWSPASVPGAADGATIGVGGTVTVTVNTAESVGSLTLADANATVALNNSLTLGSTLDLTAGKFDLLASGTLVSGTITGSGLLSQGGTLSGVANDGTLDMSASGSRLTVTNGITLAGAGGTGPGTVLLTGGNSYLRFSGTQTLDNAAVSIGGTSGAGFFYAAGAGTTLTLGPNLSITQTGGARLYANAGATLVNTGTINAGLTNGTMYLLSSGSFSNQGTISISNGDDFDVATGIAFSNTGTITLASGGKLHLKDNLATGAIGTVTNSGGTVFIDGTLTNTGSVLSTGTAGAGTVALTGLITGGTITGSGLLGRGGTLSGVANDGTLDMSTSGSRLTITNGITLAGAGGTGPGTVLLTGGNSYLRFSGTQTLDNAAVSIGGTSGAGFFYAAGAGTTLTLGPNLSITQTGGARLYANAGASIVNTGAINAGMTNGTLYLRGSGSFTNQGTINVTNGDDFDVAAAVAFSNTGTITLSSGGELHLRDNLATGAIGTVTNSGGTVFIDGTLTNTGSVLSTGTAGVGTVALTGLITGGTITGSGLLGRGGTLSGVANDGTLDMSTSGSRLTITNGITLAGAGGTGPGTVLLTGGNSYLQFSGTQTLDNAAVSIGGTSGAGFFYAAGAGTTLTLGPNLSITQTGGARLYANAGASIVNTGAINAGMTNGTLYLRGSGSFTNQGTINVTNGDDFDVAAAVAFSNTGTITLSSGGQLHLRDNLTTGAIGTVSSSGGTVFIDGTLTNTGSVLATGTTGIRTVALTGLVSGGTITGSAMRFQSGTLSGVVYDGPLDMSASGSRLTVDGGGITLTGTSGTGPGSLLLTGGNSYLLFSGTQTLDNAAVSIGGTSGTGFLYETGAGATLTLGPNLSITQTGRSARLDANAGDAIVNTGTINAGVTSGGLYVVGSGGFTNQGTINVSNGDDFEVFTTVSGTGTIDLASGALVSLRSAVGSGQVVSFVDGTGRLSLSQPGSFAGSVQGFQRGDTIDVKGIGLAASYTYNSASHLLTLNNGGGTQVAQITLSTSAATPLFTIGTDGGGGTMFAVLSQSYFIGTYTSGIVLSNPAIQQPSTVAATGSVTNTTTAHSGDAVYGTNAAAWDFTNLGTLTATGSISTGVHLVAGGTVTNGASGAAISGVQYGVLIGGPAGTVANSGTITATGTGGTGLRLVAGGTIDNLGTIKGGSLGIFLDAATGVTNGQSGSSGGSIVGASGLDMQGAGTVINYGTITGTTGVGVYMPAGGSVANLGTIGAAGTAGIGVDFHNGGGILTNGQSGSSAGLITAGHYGVYFGGTGGSVTNYGTVAGGAEGVIIRSTLAAVVNSGTITGSGDGVYFSDGGSITNRAGGTISGAGGVDITGTTGTVANIGTITGTTTGGEGVELGAGGSVTNGASGATSASISGLGAGVRIDSLIGTVANSATISATGTAGDGVVLTAGGSVTNAQTGVIEGQAYGTAAGAGVSIGLTSGTVINHGVIDVLGGGYPTGIYLGAGGSVANYGTVSANGGGNGGAVNLALGGKITNELGGLLEASGNAVVISGSAGTLVNYGTVRGRIDGVDLKSAGGTVSNYGTITGTTAYGVYLYAGGSATNSSTGVIEGRYGGVIATHSAGTVVNFGAIDNTGSSGNGVNLALGGAVTNTTGGSIQGTDYGVVVRGAVGTVINYGTIAGTGASDSGVGLDAGGNVTNASSAAISGVSAGVYISGGVGSVGNSGTIEGTGTSSNAVLLRAGGTVDNAAGGVISGGSSGVYINGGVGSVGNSGTIESSGTNSNAVLLRAGGTVDNAAGGVMVGDLNGVLIENALGTITNHGTMEGSGVFGGGASLYAGGTISNASAGALITGLYSGAYVKGGFGSVSNIGTITVTGTFGYGIDMYAGGIVTNGASGSAGGLISGTVGGIYITGGAGTVANYGTIVTFGTIVSSGTTFGAGVSLGSPGSTLTNAGTITGGGGTAVAFTGGNNRLILDPGAVFSGVVNGGTGGDTLELGSAASIGTLSGLGTNFLGFDSVTVDAGATWLLTGTNTLGATTTLTNGGTLEVGGTLANSGTIHGTAASAPGVFLTSGGSLSNSALIDGAYGGVYGFGGASSLTNSGTIASTSASRDGVYLGSGGTVTNTGSIHGLDGVDLRNSGTVINSGDITGTGSGNVGGIFLGFYYTAGAFAVTNTGTISSTATGVLMRGAGSIVNGATTATAAAISGYIGLAIFGAGTVTNYGTITGTGGTAISLGFSNDVVVLEPGSKLQGAIAGFRPGDTIDMVGLVANGDTYAGGVLTLTNNGTVEAQLTLSTTATGPTFPLTSDGNGGTLITELASSPPPPPPLPPPPPPPPPPLAFSISPNPASVFDNAGQLTFTITRSDSSAATSVHVSTVQDQGFVNNGDYTDLNGAEVNFAAGVSTAQVSVAITDTGATSGSEVFRLIVQQSLRDPASTYLATDNFTIVNTGAVSPPPPPPPPPGSGHLITLAPGPQIVTGGVGDTIIGSTGPDAINALAGFESIIGGSGATTVYGGVGDTIIAGSGSTYIDGSAGGMKIAVGSGGTDIIIGSIAPAAGAGGDTLTGGAAVVQIEALGRGDIVDFAGQTGSAVINAIVGNVTMTLGAGPTTVYGGVGDTVTIGSVSQYVDGTAGGMAIAAGSGGTDIIIGSISALAGAGIDTLTGGAAAVQIQSLGKGDIVDFAAQTGSAAINATAGNIAVTLGAGPASVYGGTGDTVALGSVSQYADGTEGGMKIAVGSGGTDIIIGSTVPGAGDTITGGAAALDYNPGVGGDLINLAGTTGGATINAFGTDTGPVNDTVIASNGGDSVWGGQGDRIGVGTGASGTDLFTHATTIPGASIGFGTNDAVVAATYGGTAGAVTVNSAIAGASSARVSVGGFAENGGTPTDFIFYPGESSSTSASIVATSTQVVINGTPSTQFTLPDGTLMTLLGVPQADFNSSFFKP